MHQSEQRTKNKLKLAISYLVANTPNIASRMHQHQRSYPAQHGPTQHDKPKRKSSTKYKLQPPVKNRKLEGKGDVLPERAPILTDHFAGQHHRTEQDRTEEHYPTQPQPNSARPSLHHHRTRHHSDNTPPRRLFKLIISTEGRVQTSSASIGRFRQDWLRWLPSS